MKITLMTFVYTLFNTGILFCQWWKDQPPMEEEGGDFLGGLGGIALLILIVYGLIRLHLYGEKKEKEEKEDND